MPTDTAYTIKEVGPITQAILNSPSGLLREAGPITQAILNSPSRPALLTARRYKVLKRRLREYEKTLKQMTKALDSYDKKNEEWDRRAANIKDRMSEAQERIMNNENLDEEDIQERSERLVEKTIKKLEKVENSRATSNVAVDRAYRKLEELIEIRADIDRLLDLPVNRYVPLDNRKTLVRPLKAASSKIARWSAFWMSKLSRKSQKKKAYKEEYKMRKAFKDLDEEELEQADQKIREKNEMSQNAKMARLDQFFHENDQDNLRDIVDASLRASGKKRKLMAKAEKIDQQNLEAQKSLENLRERKEIVASNAFSNATLNHDDFPNIPEEPVMDHEPVENDPLQSFTLPNHSSSQAEPVSTSQPETHPSEPVDETQRELQKKEAEVRQLLSQVNEETVSNSGIKKENEDLKQKSDSLKQEEDNLKKEIADKQAEEAKIREEAERYRKAADAQMKNLSQMQEILQMRIHDLHEEKKALTTENEQLAGLINSRQQDVEVAKQERQAAQQSVVAATGDRDKERLRNEQATASYQQLLAEFKKYNISLPTSPLEVAPTPMENDPLAGFTLPGHSSTEVDEPGKGRTR